ncbi:RNA ligase [Mycobacterium phage Netyap]|uniref:RNA ligase n=2 Tax=Faithunavirus TaxID=2948705 RepID=F6M883_9CAUD|nr:RNA ligase [Mycobacterium phage Faith1]YP_009017309.1 RNA ligase [Mycobacterium phage Rumpelstiltskin]YP_009292601.1 RNA ligase [Mycobacterium phage Gardann]ASR87472.1 RNA ligase [Mycobacterium phage Nicholasp3]QGZ16599.1 RNA ligase [Mycobacterium phage Gabriela]QGZ17048.1 RNA ligase [Mycobacterium phage Itos]QSM01002.1 RNA ligase [Mycobacterium phage Netyap]AEF57270.1 RNA ligase [Mycobacterium phage Faith1]
MSFDAPENANYAATIVKLPQGLLLEGLDNLVGVPMFGYQALTQKEGYELGALRVLFMAETQLDTEYARENNLFREATLNRDASETGYLEPNARVKALRLRKHQSDALLMPVESLAYTGYDVSTLKPGDTFDKLNGHTICRKYVPKGKKQATQGQPKVRKQVDEKLFPKHLDTVHLFRNLHYFRDDRRVVVTQKLHGTSWRGGNIPVNRTKGRFERFLNRLGIVTPDTEYKHVYGSRNVVKGRSENNHYYDTDLWAKFGEKLEGKIPENFIIYGELVGWVSKDEPIQRGYTYNLPPGECELYVYRVVTVNPKGVIADLSWEGVKDFCRSLDLKTAPELRNYNIQLPDDLEDKLFTEYFAREYLDIRYCDQVMSNGESRFPEAIPLSDRKTVDEGVCVRIEGQIPHVFKAKSPKFLEHETKQLDKGEVDLESVA